MVVCLKGGNNALQLREGCQQRSKELCQEYLAKIKVTFERLQGSLGQFMELENQRKVLEANM